ncbi:MAG: TonB-dependent receptor [Acidobacteria bacterium]|nr:TonB-dependent receptor [Acidobacteriota bacterium]
MAGSWNTGAMTGNFEPSASSMACARPDEIKLEVYMYMKWQKANSRICVLAVLILILLRPAVAVAQMPTATVLGIVKDKTGAVIAGAAVMARNLETAQARNGISAADGSYRLSALAVGTYEIRVETPGFQPAVRTGLSLTVGQEAVVNFTLDVSAVEQTIAVMAEAPIVNTTSGSLGSLVDEQRMVDLPLNGRNYLDLALLQPGIMQQKNQNHTTAGGSGLRYSSNGASPYSNYFLLDGAPVNNAFGAAASSITETTLGIDGIREFRVVTGAYSAEYGMAMGSQMTIVSKGGTNNFHGSVLEYFRNSALDARNFFDYKTIASQRRLPAFTRNNFGGSFGGPIKKDRIFFHTVYEGLRERLGRPIINQTIPLSARVDGGLVPQINPVIKPWLSLLPEPNLPGDRYTYAFSQPTTENYGQTRWDYNFSDIDTLFGRYTIDDAERTTPALNATGNPHFIAISTSRSQYGTLSQNHVFSPALLNTFRMSYSRNGMINNNPSVFFGPQFSFVPGQGFGAVTIGGITAVGPGSIAPFGIRQEIFTWSDDLFYTRGKHSLKFGTLINRYQWGIVNSIYSKGVIAFADVRSFLLGTPLSYQAATQGSKFDRKYRFWTLGFYIQNDYRASSTFTLNLGLRYEPTTNINETHGNQANIRDAQRDATTTPGILFMNPSLHNFSPRFGFAWDVHGNGRTSIRGGFGLLYDIATQASTLVMATAVPPVNGQAVVTNPPPLTSLPLVFSPANTLRTLRTNDYNLQQPHLFSYNLTVERELPFNMGVTLTYATSRAFNLVTNTDGNPTIPQVLPDGRKFWTGTEPRTNPNWSFLDFRTGSSQSWYNALQFGVSKRLSRGLQFQSSYSWGKVLDTIQSRIGTDAVGDSIGVDPNNIRVDKAAAGFDATQNWRFNALYRLPEILSGSPRLAKLLTGWWFSGILSLQTGYPVSAMLATNRSRSAVRSTSPDRPDLLPGRRGNTSGTTSGCLGVTPGQLLGTPDLYFDPCAFGIQRAGFLGTAGRNILRGPGLANLDFSLAKDTSLSLLGEGGKLEFRAEVFNLLNRANFDLPSNIMYTGRLDTEPVLRSAGKIGITGTSSRQVQFALKLLF